MEQTTSLMSLMIVVGIAFLIPILLHHLKLRALPVVVAEIVAGLIIGKSGFNIVTDDPWLNLLSLLGFIYLMFLSGVEIDFNSFSGKSKQRKGEPNPLIISLIIFVAILLLSFVFFFILVMLGFVSEPYLMTLIIATISLGVVMPVLKEKKLMKTGIGQTILLVTVISDFVTMILLAVYLSALSKDFTKMLLLIVFFVLVFVTYILAKRFSNRGLFALISKGTVQLGTRAVFALILLFVVLSETLGVENILGAFLAGVIVSLLMPDRDFAHQLDTFGYGFLIPIFFVMVGVNLDLWKLFADPKVFLLIPLLLMMIFLSKMVPSLILKKWYPWPNVVGAGLLISATLSLVIAASTIALQMNIINEQMHGALILVAILSCLVFPVLFNKVYPKEEERNTVVSIIGANHVTLPVAHDLLKSGYEIKMFASIKPDDTNRELKRENGKNIPVIDIELTVSSLTDNGAFEADIIVFGSMDDEANIRLAKHAQLIGIQRIITRVETPDHENIHVEQEGMVLFSTLYASRTLLKALIEHPTAVELITQDDDSIHEIRMDNPHYHDRLLRELPLPINILILRIYRGESFIIPHGNTQVQQGDRLLVSGNAEDIHSLKEKFEY
ncbi:monovalent cation:proton antiporter family protein [Bacillus aquiflavi]|uniref:monovalent cation:proton antiporter family protein n=1 Tax=Bacillus aquiflavi TaxID=2672567 RepID=UPI001CA887BA|nr:monovalent cation:proton antiporter family protein [Bacillus aquiflavi]UAC48018.1 monovalent cation:proton antiporter family protein [Bacillus aquiflavi]